MDVPFDSVPLFVKAGSVIPVMDPRIQTLNSAINESVITMKKLEVRKLIIFCDKSLIRFVTIVMSLWI